MKLKTSRTGLEIAVVGLAGAFPGAADAAAFWQLLLNGHSAITQLSDDELRASGVHPDLLGMENFVKAKGVFPDLEYFDAAFFDYTPRDAALMDPQVRLLHQCVYHALEDAGYIGEGYKGSIGLFAAASGNFVWELSSLLDTKESAASQFATIQLNDKDFVATRIAYKLNLRGPCVTVHCACSTSLYAIDMACRQLLTGACSIAVAAAAGLNLPHKNGYVYEEGMILSPDGVCRPFSDDANGTVEGNGMGAVVLKPLEAALRDRDRIYAVIRGSGANNDGARKVGYSAPSVEGQAEVIRRALHMAEVEPTSISYIETHGTGTALGDPVEIEGLKQAFRTDRSHFCGIGSLKSNIGHLDTAAGISSFIKTVLALQHRTLPPSIHFHAPNREIDFSHSPFYVVTEPQPWHPLPLAEGSDEYHPLRAGVSSFGIGGTNVHVVLEEAPALPPSVAGREWQLFCLSAADGAALERLEGALADHLTAHPEQNLADLAYTLQIGRRNLAQRSAFIGRHREELLSALAAGAEGGRRYPRAANHQRPRVVLLLSGQGTQYPGMGAGLYQSEPSYREALDRCLAICDRQQLPELRRLLTSHHCTAEDSALLERTDLAQPALFALEYATASLLLAWGVTPAALVGHSLGEYVAACLAQTLDLEQALALVIARGQLMREMAPGAMLAVAAAASEIEPLLPEGIDIAAINGPAQCSVAGPSAAIEALVTVLEQRAIQCKRLHTSHAFHSASMEPLLPAFRQRLAQVSFAPPRIPYLSNLTGDWITPEQAQDPDYYLRHLRHTVQFAAAAEQLLADPATLFVEVGPGGVLGAFIKQCAREQSPITLSVIRHARAELSDEQQLLRAVGDLWGHGAPIDWKRYHQGALRSKVAAPLYPFARQICPIGKGDIYRLLETVGSGQGSSATTVERGATLGWHDALLPALDDSANVRPALAVVENRQLVKPLGLVSGLRINQCRAGGAFAPVGSGLFTADLQRASDYRRLIHALKEIDGMPELVVWLAERANLATLRPLLDRLARLLLVLRSECPGQRFRCLLALPASRAERSAHSAVTGELELTLRSLRASSPQVDLRAVYFDPALPLTARAELLEREIYDSDRSSVLVSYDKQQRRLYRPVALATPPAAPRLAQRTIGLIAPTDFPSDALATRLGEASGAQVVLLSAHATPLLWGDSQLGVSAAEIDDWLRADQQQSFSRHGLRDFSDCHALLDEAATTLVARYLDSRLPLTHGRHFSRADLLQATRVTPRLEKYLDYMLAMLLEDGVVSVVGDGYQVERTPTDLRDLAPIRAELAAASHLFPGNLEVLEHCVAAFPAALSEEVPPISVLYPDGTNEMLTRAYVGSIQELEEQVIRATFEKLFQQLIRRANGRPLRLLEAGGGFGLTMRRLAPLLRGVEVEYYFTDVGRTFLHEAREFARNEGYDFLTFGLFDISRPPAEQGLPLHSFDLVFAFNVVHATRSLAVSVGHLRQLLRDGGLLCLLERTRPRRYIDLIWGLADGWWHFDDSERHLSPLTDLDHWQAVARAAGFSNVGSFPESAEARRCLETGILIAQLAPAGQAARAEQWEIDPAPGALDGVVVIDAPAVRPAPPFEPYGDRLLTPRPEGRGYGAALLQWLSRQRPGFVSIWSDANALAAADQLERSRATLALDQQGRALLGAAAWSRIELPLRPLLPSLSQVAEALGTARGGVAHAVLAAASQTLYNPPPPPGTEAEEAGAALRGALEEGGVGEYERLLHKLWGELFGIEQIALDEDFFELGGDSLKVAQVTAELERYGIKLLPNEVFNYPTIRLLARYLHDNRQSEFGRIRSVAELIDYWRQAGSEAAFVSAPHASGTTRVLYLDDATLARSPAPDQLLLELRLPPELQPHYIAPLAQRPAPESREEATAIWQGLGLTDQPAADTVAALSARVAQGMTQFNRAIGGSAVVASYPLSPFQRMFLKEANRVAFYLIDFHDPIDQPLLARALGDVVALQGLLRSRLRRDRWQKLVWDEFAPPSEPLTIPLLDLSGATPPTQAELMEQLMAAEQAISFDAIEGVMYRVMLVRFDRCRHTLLFNLDHSIFDNMSGQVLRRQLLSRYRQLRAGNVAPMEPVKSFRHYLEQLNRGPQGITKQKLVEIFDLERYIKVKNVVEERIVARRQPEIKKLRFALDLDRYNLSDDDDATWEVSLAVLCCTLGRFLEQETVPLKIVYQGRQYQDLSYFDTLGLFIDILPLLVPVDRENPANMIEGIRRKVRFVNRYNVNFMNMLMHMTMRIKWWEALAALNANKLSKRDPMILLNYVGKAEAEYQKIIDFSSRQMEGAKGNLGYASLYIIVTRVERTINFDLFCNFEPDMDRLRQLFESESAKLFGPIAEPVAVAATQADPAEDAA